MKYVFFANALEPAFCVAPDTHARLAARNAGKGAPVSAGYVEFLPTGVRTFGHSHSLELGPRPGDAQLIAAFYKQTLAQGVAQEARDAAPQ